VSEGLDFLDLMRGIERKRPDQPRIGSSGSRAEDVVMLGQEPHVDFSRFNVVSVAETKDGKPLVLSRFLGLLGPQGALPLHTTYETAHWNNMRDPAFARFLDVFNHRFLQLFYRAWANARPAVQADRPHDNQFVLYIGSMIGIGTPATQKRGAMHDFNKLALTGLLSPAVKSASRLENMIAWMFKVRVAIEQFTGVWLPLEENEQSVLSKGKCGLGVGSLIGRSAFSLQDKFRIRIAVRSLGEFEAFLPDGKFFRLLADAVDFYLGSILIYDVALGLPEGEATPLQLGGFGRLGWTSWMGRNPGKDKHAKRWDCRFHPAELR
jgi:type VI secretion system protein ImpH